MHIKSAIETLVNTIDPEHRLIQIAAVGTVAAEFQKPILLSIVAIEENTKLRDRPDYVSHANVLERPLLLSVSILFSSVDTDYLRGIDLLQGIMTSLEDHRGFSVMVEKQSVVKQITGIGAVVEPNEANQITVEQVPLTINMVPLTIEQRAQLWSCLGVGYKPSVLYQLMRRG